MKKLVSIFIYFGVISELVACNLPASPSSTASVGQEIAQQYQTVSAYLTGTAQPVSAKTAETTATATFIPPAVGTASPAASAAGTASPAKTASPVGTGTQPITATPAATQAATPAASQTQNAESCNQAQPGRPIDITIPDETQFSPGQYFSKTWRLVNAGTCTWTNNYSVVWFSGDDLGASRQQKLNNMVEPGKSSDITVDMIAPMEPGAYQSNWKLSNEAGQLFGIGPNGNAPIWVRIVVVAQDTPTSSQPEPTATSIPIIFARGALSLSEGEAAELDSGTLVQADKGDVTVKRSGENQPALETLNGGQLAFFGIEAPSLEDCLLQPMGSASFALNQLQTGGYYCYRTNRGLVGNLTVQSVDSAKGNLTFDFLTWSVP